MKKKIAVVFSRFYIGGAENSLIGFLKNINTEKYDVTLITFSENIPEVYKKDIPDTITVKYFDHDSKKVFLNYVKRFDIKSVLESIYYRIGIRLTKNEYKRYMYSILTYPKVDKIFDCVISYKLNWQDLSFSLHNIQATKKCSLYHETFGKLSRPDDLIRKWIGSIDRIFCVSEVSKKSFELVYPNSIGKTDVLFNIIDAKKIMDKSNEYNLCLSENGFNLCTCARYEPVKGQHLIPQITRILLDSGCDIHWYLVGDGSLRETIESECEKYNVTDRVILLGSKENPYPYMKNCDIYVQTSFSEGWCLTVQEARILHKPIVVTPIPVMHEQIVSGENGLIADDFTPESIAESIKTLIDHPEMKGKFIKALEKEKHDNTSELQKLYDFIES